MIMVMMIIINRHDDIWLKKMRKLLDSYSLSYNILKNQTKIEAEIMILLAKDDVESRLSSPIRIQKVMDQVIIG